MLSSILYIINNKYSGCYFFLFDINSYFSFLFKKISLILRTENNKYLWIVLFFLFDINHILRSGFSLP